jgi:hypothetical protein
MFRSTRLVRRALRRAYSSTGASPAETAEMKSRLTKSNRLLAFYMGAAAAATCTALAYQMYGTLNLTLCCISYASPFSQLFPG